MRRIDGQAEGCDQSRRELTTNCSVTESTHSWVSTRVASFKGSIIAASVQTYRSYILGKPKNHELCLSTHGHLPGTLRYVYYNVFAVEYLLVKMSIIIAVLINKGRAASIIVKYINNHSITCCTKINLAISTHY